MYRDTLLYCGGQIMAIPSEILAVARPKGTVVKYVKGHYYVVKRTSKYVEGRRVPVDLGIIGSIIDGKYVERQTPVLKNEIDIKDYGPVALCDKVGKSLLETLKPIYGDKDATTLYVLALIRAVYGDVTAREMKYRYDTSFISEMYGAAVSESMISDFLESIGQRYLKIQEYMKEDAKAIQADTLLIDGTLRNSNGETTFSQWSRKGAVKNSEDMSILYAYDIGRKEPVASKPYPGNMLDSTAFIDFIKLFDVSTCLLIMDKGFWNTKDINAIRSYQGLSYLIPTKRNTRQIADLKLLQDYDGLLDLPDADVQFKKTKCDNNTFFYSFRDLKIAREEASVYIKKQKSKDEFAYEKFADKETSFGTIVFESNRDMEPKDVYTAYMERWQIELMFKFFKSVVDIPPTRVHDEYRIYATEFINLLSTKITCRVRKEIDAHPKLSKYSYKQIMDYLANIKKVRVFDSRVRWTYNISLKYINEISEQLGLFDYSV